MKEELIRMQQLKTAYVIPLALSTMGIIPNKLHETSKLLNPRPGVCIRMRTAVMLNPLAPEFSFKF